MPESFCCLLKDQNIYSESRDITRPRNRAAYRGREKRGTNYSLRILVHGFKLETNDFDEIYLLILS